MVRTREIIKGVSYDDLLKEGIIPDIVYMVKNNKSAMTVKTYPEFIKKRKLYAFFGLVMDYVIRASIRINIDQKVDLGKDPMLDMSNMLANEAKVVFQQIFLNYCVSDDFTTIALMSFFLCALTSEKACEELQNVQPYIQNMEKMANSVINKWKSFGQHIKGDIYFNTEYCYDCIEGHPDVVVLSENGSIVIDIKNSYNFRTMSKESSLQILTYYALMKMNKVNIKYAGFILPMQEDIIIYDLSQWDPTNFLRILLMKTVPTINAPLKSFKEIYEGISTKIGSHISKKSNIKNSINDYISKFPGRPIQMFLTNPRTGKRRALTNKQIQETFHLIKTRNVQYFTHAPYVINLCSNQFDSVTGHWQQRILNEELQLTSELGGLGVIVHTGARKTLPEDQALFIMENMVRTSLQYASVSCPLLLETPCGEGTEVTTTMEELANFFFRFTEIERSKLGVCIDTAHIFGAGYDPLNYLDYWYNNYLVPIRLVHYNDSAVHCGSRKDKHAFPGTGYIGETKMANIAIWCNERRIPMVIE